MRTTSDRAAAAVRSLRMALEPRLMLDGDPAVAAAEAASATPSAASAPPTPAESAPAAARNEIVFVFSDVADAPRLAAEAAPAGAEIVMIDAAEDGLARMAAELAGREGVDAIHVLAHGEAGGIDLGAAMLDVATTEARAGELAAIGRALAPDGDLLFYGCDSGRAAEGAALARALAEATGADVALSDDPTGGAAQGGDWDLEVRAGEVGTMALEAPHWGSLLAMQTTRASIDSNEDEATGGGADMVAVSSDGRFVAFSSTATNLVAGDTNGAKDVFLRDTVAGTTIRVNKAWDGGQTMGGASTLSDMSDDGRYIVFTSAATNLLPDADGLGGLDDTNNATDVFRYDTVTGTTVRVSVRDNGAQANGASSLGTISSDGRYVAFLSSAANLDVNPAPDVFVRDVTGGHTYLVSKNNAGVQANGPSSAPQISANGQYVVFVNSGVNMDGNATADIFRREWQGAGATLKVNPNPAGGADSPSISENGRYVAYRTGNQIYLRDLVANTTLHVSAVHDALGNVTATGNGASASPVISGGGDFVAFQSAATNLVSGDTNGQTDIFLYDVAGKTMTRVSVSSAGVQADAGSDQPAIGSDGGHVAFRSQATNLAGSNPAGHDIFLRKDAVETPASRSGTTRHTAPAPPPPPPTGIDAPSATLLGHEAGDALPPAPPPPPPGTAEYQPPPPPDGATAQAAAPPPAGPPGTGTGQLPPGPLPMPGTPGFERLTPEQRRALMGRLPPRHLAKMMADQPEPAAQVAANLINQAAAGKDVSLSEAKLAMENEGASTDVVRANLAVVERAIKAARTEKLAGALTELARDPGAADAFAKSSGAPLKDIQVTSNKVAILIGVDDYKGTLPKLGTPAKDVGAVSAVLAERFGYQTIVAENATKSDMVGLIRSVGERLGKDGSLVVYYAGHGYAVEATGEGYWLPADARADNARNWVSTRDLSGYLGQVQAGQIMVVSDSCYSGAMTREMRLTSDAIGVSREQLVQRRAVTAFSSGGEEPVADGGPGGHSVFAANLLKSLEKAEAGRLGFEIFGQVRTEVARELPQVPTYGGLTSAGHAGATDYVIGGR